MRQKFIATILLTLAISTFVATNVFANPIFNYDYHNTENGHSPAALATGGLNITNPNGTHTAYGNPALLAFRDNTNIATTFRLYHDTNSIYNSQGMPPKNSFEWKKEHFTYLGVDAKRIGVSYSNLADLKVDRQEVNEDRITNYYADYYLDAYRISVADNTGGLSFGLSVSLLKGRMVYLSESSDNEFAPFEREVFIDSKGLGYSIDFGAAVHYGALNYGLMIPNVLSRVYWQDEPNKSLDRKVQLAAQWGNEKNYIVSGISRKFDFKSPTIYHMGFQQNFYYGAIKGIEYYMPLRLGLYGKSFKNISDNVFSIGSGFTYSYFQFDSTYSITDIKNNHYMILSALSVGF